MNLKILLEIQYYQKLIHINFKIISSFTVNYYSKGIKNQFQIKLNNLGGQVFLIIFISNLIKILCNTYI